MELAVRRVKEQDIPLLAGFEKEISLISFGEEAITDESFHEAKIRRAFVKNNEGMLVMTADDVIIGWLWMDQRANSLTGEKYINFRSFYISETWRGKGARLLEEGMVFCRNAGAESVVGKVHINNLGMRALYKNFGFQAAHLSMELRLNRKIEPC